MNDLLNFAFSDSGFVQILNELLSLHPVDERTHVSAVAEKRSAGQVHRAACKNTHHNTSPYISSVKAAF